MSRLAVLATFSVLGLATPGIAQDAPPATEAPPAPPAEPAPPVVVTEPTPATPAAPAAKKAVKRKKVKKATTKKAVVKKKSAAKTASIGKVPAGAARLDVDISSQTMRIYKGGKLYRTVPVSTGSGKRYCNAGKCAIATTPRGSYRIYNHISGWRTAPLGKLYNPLYFTGGYAIHGGRLPGYPASHGCVRVSMSVAGWLPRVAGVGSSVYIHN